MRVYIARTCTTQIYLSVATLYYIIISLHYITNNLVLSAMLLDSLLPFLDGLLRTDERLRLCIDHTHAALVTSAAFN